MSDDSYGGDSGGYGGSYGSGSVGGFSDSGGGWGGSYSDDSSSDGYESGSDAARNSTTYQQNNSPSGTDSSGYNPNASPSSSYNPGWDANTVNDGNRFSPAQRDAWAGMTPQEQREFNVKNGLPASDIYNYNVADRGWRERITDATTADPNSIMGRLGFRGAGMTLDQFLDNETPEERGDRARLIFDGLATGFKALAPAPISLGFDAAMGAGRVAQGMPVSQAFGNMVPGIINGALNRATGGALGTVNQIGSISAALGGPSIPNAGAVIYDAMGGKYPGKTVNNPTTGDPYRYPSGSPVSLGYTTGSSPSSNHGSSQSQAPVMPAAPSQSQQSQDSQDLDANFWDIDGAGWTTAKSKYMSAKKAGGY